MNSHVRSCTWAVMYVHVHEQSCTFTYMNSHVRSRTWTDVHMYVWYVWICKCKYMKRRETKQNNRMFRSDPNRNETNWSETKRNETNYEAKLRNMAVGFASIPNEAEKLMRNKAKRNKLRNKTNYKAKLRKIIVCFASLWIVAKQS